MDHHPLGLKPGAQFAAAPSPMKPGFVLIDKPRGVLSFAVVRRVRSILRRGLGTPDLKVGHGGTLDAFANGLLVIGIGAACKHLTSILKGPKRYSVMGLLGTETDTLDPSGSVTKTTRYDQIQRRDLLQALSKFTGEIQQTPPLYSAVKIDGKRASDRVRNGEEVTIGNRPVSVYSLDLTAFNPPAFRLDVHCSSGFYVRSLVPNSRMGADPGLSLHPQVRDLGLELDSCAHATALIRTQNGPFSLSDPEVIGWSDLSQERIFQHCISVDRAADAS